MPKSASRKSIRFGDYRAPEAAVGAAPVSCMVRKTEPPDHLTGERGSAQIGRGEIG